MASFVTVERRSSLTRRAALAGTTLLLLVGLTGCNGKAPVGRGPVASVDGTEITLDEVRDVTEAQAAYLKAAFADAEGNEQATAALAAFQGENDHVLGADGVAQVLGLLIQVEAVEGLVEAEGIEITDADRAGAEELVNQRLEQFELTDNKDVAAVFALETRYRVAFAALQRGLPNKEPEERARALYDENLALFEDAVCIQQIATTDEASAQDAAARLADGEDFAAVAQATSVQPDLAVEGNEASCIPRENMRGVFGDDVDDAGVGDLLGPADGQGAWIIVRIWDERALEFEDVREQLLQSVGETESPEQAVNAAVAAHLAAMDVTVDPRYGTWDATTGSVIAPVDPLVDPAGEFVPLGS